MIIQKPIAHWNSFTVQELREILEHCRALERLGIAQDEEMIVSIERDITLREKIRPRYGHFESKHTKTKRHKEKQNYSKTEKKQQPQMFLLEQNA